MKDKRAFRFSSQLQTTKKVGHCGVPNLVSSLRAKVKPIDPMRAVASSTLGGAQTACFNSDTIGPILGASSCAYGIMIVSYCTTVQRDLPGCPRLSCDKGVVWARRSFSVR